MPLQVRTDPGTTSNSNVHKATHRGGLPLGVVVGAVFLAMAGYSMWIAAWKPMFIALGCSVAMPVVIPVAWAIGNFLRRVAAPDAVITSGMGDTLKQRAFWLFGPQLIACGIVALPLILIVTDGIKKGQVVAAGRAKERARAKEAEESRAIAAKVRQEREERLAQLRKLTPEEEAAFRAQVETTASSMGLPLSACLSEELLGMHCADAGFMPDPSIAQIGVVPMRIGLASRQPTDEDVRAMILKHFAAVASRAVSGDTTLGEAQMSCAGSLTQGELNEQVSLVIRDMFFAGMRLKQSPVEERLWDWIVEANGLTAVIMSLGPYPFDTPSEAVVKTWNNSINALRAREQEVIDRVAALRTQWNWERSVLAQFSTDRQKLTSAESGPGFSVPLRAPSSEEANELDIPRGSSKVGEMQLPRTTRTMVYAVLQGGGAFPFHLLQQSAADSATLSMRVMGTDQPDSRRDITFPLPIGVAEPALVQRVAGEVPWGGTVRFLLPAESLPALGVSGPARNGRVVVECQWTEYRIALRDPGRTMPPFQDSPIVLGEQLGQCLGSKFNAGGGAIGSIDARVTEPVACLPTADTFDQLLREGAARVMESPVPEVRFPAGVPASVPIKW